MPFFWHVHENRKNQTWLIKLRPYIIGPDVFEGYKNVRKISDLSMNQMVWCCSQTHCGKNGQKIGTSQTGLNGFDINCHFNPGNVYVVVHTQLGKVTKICTVSLAHFSMVTFLKTSGLFQSPPPVSDRVNTQIVACYAFIDLSICSLILVHCGGCINIYTLS